MSIVSVHSQEQCDYILADLDCYAYLGAESDGTGVWSWHDGTAWDFVNPENDGIVGIGETRMVFQTNGQWHDWANGEAMHGVVCSSDESPVRVISDEPPVMSHQ